ncbi:MAG: GNAT family N-acetyltransferase [Alphaproteobacteria bacterium]|nr:GNAT family N-acetyltransferase [Alphaproteobacteria bacterium]
MDKDLHPTFVIMKMPIVTPRLIIRPLRVDDAAHIAAVTDETWDDLRQWLRWAQDRARMTDIDTCRFYAQKCHDDFLDIRDFTFAGFVKETGDFALISRLSFAEEALAYEFGGYWCRKKYQGNGYVGEAVNAIARYAAATFNAQSFRITHAAGHVKTRAIIDRLGFEEIEIRPQAHILPDGSVTDEHVLLLRDIQKLPPLAVTYGG